jgi:endonuclease YncB( thermonuclease family)
MLLTMRPMFRTLALALLLALPFAAAADITGTPRIIDGDTIAIARQDIRLFGIDAPEHDQVCRDARGDWRCGFEATNALTFFIARNWVTCLERDTDRYGRTVAVCHAGGVGGPDLGEHMVREGWALAYRQYSDDYIAAEGEARANKRGIWRGDFVPPWDWRRGTRLTESTTAESPPSSPDQAAAPSEGPTCCKICRTGTACGNSCIAGSKTCRQEPGCACDVR